MKFTTPKVVGATNLPYTPAHLNSCPNGLFRATFDEAHRLTPHQVTASAEHCWRVFLRLTHKSCLPDRPKTSVLRRHSQVYLDSATFGW